MRVLMISPHPVYTPRGTPISVLNRCRALCALGHEVDLVTYPIGEDVAVDGLAYRRAARLPGAGHVAIGPSARKAALDLDVAASALRRAFAARRSVARSLLPASCRHPYDVVHTHEEAGLIGPALASLLHVPHVYDMGNDWTAVLENYGRSPSHPLVRLAGHLERSVVARSTVVIAHFASIAESLASSCSTPVHVAFNVALDPEPDSSAVAATRRAVARDGAAIVVYTGTLEPYQGLELLLDAMALLSARRVGARLVVAGGEPERIAELQSYAARLGIAGSVDFLGTLEPLQADALVRCADVAVSPRLAGSNTPLKLFSYLRAGTPIVATATIAHRQVLDEDAAVLVPAKAAALAEGIAAVLVDGERASRLRRGASRARERFGPQGYLAAVAAAYEHAGGQHLEEGDLARATARLFSVGAAGATGGSRSRHPGTDAEARRERARADRPLAGATATSQGAIGRQVDA